MGTTSHDHGNELLLPSHPEVRYFLASFFLGVAKSVVFQKGGFGGCSPGTKTGTRVHSDVPLERKAERGYVRMFPRNENRNEGTFQNHPSQNRPFVSSRLKMPDPHP